MKFVISSPWQPRINIPRETREARTMRQCIVIPSTRCFRERQAKSIFTLVARVQRRGSARICILYTLDAGFLVVFFSFTSVTYDFYFTQERSLRSGRAILALAISTQHCSLNFSHNHRIALSHAFCAYPFYSRTSTQAHRHTHTPLSYC